jgi:hypothetical protein
MSVTFGAGVARQDFQSASDGKVPKGVNHAAVGQANRVELSCARACRCGVGDSGDAPDLSVRPAKS